MNKNIFCIFFICLFSVVSWGESKLFQTPLRVDGTKVVDGNNHEVKFRGINVGGWLVPEAWMCGMKYNDQDARFAQETLDKRFGEKRSQKLMDAWFDHWMTSADMDMLAKGGFNMIRVPFSYRTLQNADESWKLDASGNVDFSRMDWILREANKRNIYVIFDFHVWKGQHEDYQKISQERMTSDLAGAVRIWHQVALHYKGNYGIAAFDLINEPGTSPNDFLQVTLREAIRSVDPDRIVATEWGQAKNLIFDGANTIYSFHWYDGDPVHNFENFLRAEWLLVRAPVWVAEWHNADSGFLRKQLHAFNRRGWSWSPWSFKSVAQGDWAIFNYNNFQIDLEKESYENIYRSWTEGLKWSKSSKNYSLNNAMASSLNDGLSEPASN